MVSNLHTNTVMFGWLCKISGCFWWLVVGAVDGVSFGSESASLQWQEKGKPLGFWHAHRANKCYHWLFMKSVFEVGNGELRSELIEFWLNGFGSSEGSYVQCKFELQRVVAKENFSLDKMSIKVNFGFDKWRCLTFCLMFTGCQRCKIWQGRCNEVFSHGIIVLFASFVWYLASQILVGLAVVKLILYLFQLIRRRYFSDDLPAQNTWSISPVQRPSRRLDENSSDDDQLYKRTR